MSRWHDDANDDIHGIAFGNEPCRWDGCGDSHIHAFTDAELRARDERIIRAALHRALSVGVTWPWFDSDNEKQCQFSAIIADAEADQ